MVEIMDRVEKIVQQRAETVRIGIRDRRFCSGRIFLGKPLQELAPIDAGDPMNERVDSVQRIRGAAEIRGGRFAQ